MEVEIATVDALNAWDVKEYNPVTMSNIIWLTWAFKCKIKARFCARGDMQLEGIDFFETLRLWCSGR